MAERPEILLIREALDGVLAPEVTSAVLFEALAAFGSHVPRTPEEVLLMVHGPLHEVLVRRFGRREGNAVVQRMETLLRRRTSTPSIPLEIEIDVQEREDTGTAPVPLVDIPVKFEGEEVSITLQQPTPAAGVPAMPLLVKRPRVAALTPARPERGDPSVEITIGGDRESLPTDSKFRETEVTAKFAIQSKAVPVMVVASGLILEKRLASALGPVRIAPFTVGILERFEREAHNRRPPVVILDATDFPPISAEDIAAAMSTLPGTTVKAIWGIDLPYGRSVADTLKALGVNPTPFDRQEGLDPLLDVVRSRRA